MLLHFKCISCRGKKPVWCSGLIAERDILICHRQSLVNEARAALSREQLECPSATLIRCALCSAEGWIRRNGQRAFVLVLLNPIKIHLGLVQPDSVTTLSVIDKVIRSCALICSAFPSPPLSDNTIESARFHLILYFVYLEHGKTAKDVRSEMCKFLGEIVGFYLPNLDPFLACGPDLTGGASKWVPQLKDP